MTSSRPARRERGWTTRSRRRWPRRRRATPASCRPIFDPGDALLFDDLFLHQTGSDPSMPNTRYAIESWFFGPSAYPDEYVPIAF